MAKPQEELEEEEYFKDTYLLYESFGRICKDAEDCKNFLKELLTASEVRLLRRRWYIANLLIKGKSIRGVAYEARVSTTTVGRVARVLKEGRYLRKALERKIEESQTTSKRYTFGQMEGQR